MKNDDSTQQSSFVDFLEEAKASGGSEIANCQPFIERLCEHLDLPRPDLAKESNELNDYVFERRVAFKHADGSSTNGRIDLYKRNSFILEAKQSSKRKPKKKLDADQLALLPEDAKQSKLGHAKQGTRGWDEVMKAARKQAEDYARALPVEHGYPPFLLIVDVGNVIEVFADFSGQGKNYAHFPDRQSYRLSMDDLLDEDIQERLRAVWTDPLSLDPAKKSAEVTRDIADRLAKIAKRLEVRHDPKEVAEFLMRCLFTMFAEDVGLIPDKGFEKLLGEIKETPENFVPALESLWKVMDEGGYAPHLNTSLKKFNGSLFKTRKALTLEPDEIHELWVASKRDWHDVEPAIFGTLLERALETRERSKLGAHYTPRAYVERLVIPTIIEPLRSDWEAVQARIRDLLEQGEEREALRAARRFHRQLCSTRVLDPACGTGNFLYVSLELMKKLEGEVLEAIAQLGGEPDRYSDYKEEAGRDLVGQKLARSGGRFSVDPHQFYGLEINPRAVAIADLVLWIGYLKWQLKTGGAESVSEPVLDAYGTIKEQDAILAFDKQEILRGDDGKPLSRWDGQTMKLHPITGEEIPDPDAQIELYTYVNPRAAEWPEANFIVGNPPFIGGKDMRAELGDGYAEACWKARPHMPGGADFVMHFWDEAATRLIRKTTKAAPNVLRRFGFITTNSITQTFSRRVIEKHMSGKQPLSLVYAVPDHPWLKAVDKAAVRIAITVAEAGEKEGVLAQVISEAELNSDAPQVMLEKQEGKIRAKLSIGANLSSMHNLASNKGISSRGMELRGSGFILEMSERAGVPESEQQFVWEYKNGADIARGRSYRSVIDCFGLSETELRDVAPYIFQHLSTHVRPERQQNRREASRRNWWVFGEARKDFRDFAVNLPRYITTIETAKHRFFQFLDASIRPDNKLVNIGLSSSLSLSCLSTRAHAYWSMSNGGWLGVGNDSVYVKTKTFDPFPFPACVTDDTNLALTKRLEELGERLDAFRKERLAAHDFLTMTGLYNVLERVRELDNGCDVDPLSDKEKDIYEAGLIAILKDLHDEIDRAVFEAYGWEDLILALVGKPGATTPSPHKTAEQEAAEEELLSRLVALNQERAAEEARGEVRWLRPDYQIPKLGHKVATPKDEEQISADVTVIDLPTKPKWPTDGLDQIRVLREVLSAAERPAKPDELSANFKGGRNRQKRIEQVLEHMVETGMVRTGELDGDTRYFLPR